MKPKLLRLLSPSSARRPRPLSVTESEKEKKKQTKRILSARCASHVSKRGREKTYDAAEENDAENILVC